jgi:PAS domain S-box-containing protein
MIPTTILRESEGNALFLEPADDPESPALADALQSAAYLAAIVASSNDAIVSKTLDGTIRSWNAAAQRIFGYAPSEAIGQSITLIIPPELQAEERQILQKIRLGEPIEHFDTIRVRKDGVRVPISLTVSPIRDSHGTIIGASKIARDISDRKSAEARLRKTEEALRDADRRKDEFVALLAHELRNPLAPIRYALSSIEKPDCSVEQRRHAEQVIGRQAAHMSRLLDDLLDISRITRGTLELKTGHVELTSVLSNAIEAARPIIDAKRHTLTLDFPKQAICAVADPVRLTQVFSNLLINAAKYTDEGGHIELSARHANATLVVSVRDNGIGISKEMHTKIFTLFTQDHAAANRSEGGLGIGLSLVSGIVDLHGGQIEARSAGLGQGSEFIVQLPMVVAPGESQGVENHSGSASRAVELRILVVDDNADIADSCSTVVGLSGHHVQTAYTGRQALEVAAISHPHVILADIDLPDMDGYELAKKIRATHWGQRVALVAITGHGEEQHIVRSLEAGFDNHLTKPIDPLALESLLQSLGSQFRATKVSVRRTHLPDRAPKG